MADPDRHAKRYARRFIIGIVVYAVLLVAAVVVAPLATGPTRYVVMLLPLPGIGLIVRALWRYLVDSDEMIRHDQLVSLALAFGLGSVLTFTYGLLQIAGAPDLSWTLVFPVYAASWLIAHFALWLRNR